MAIYLPEWHFRKNILPNTTQYKGKCLFYLEGQFRNSKFEDKGIFGGLSPKISRAVHMMCFPPILTRRANRVAIFGVIGSLGGRSRSVDSLRGYPQNG
jgi:hypothetical protein